MEIDGRTLTKEEKAFMRRIAVQRVWDGERPSAVMDSYGLGRKTIFGWLHKANTEGLYALALRSHTVRRRELNEQAEHEVARWVTGADPRQYGFDFGMWTRQIVSDLIAWRLGVELSITSVGPLKRSWGRRGETPVVATSGQRQAINAISAVNNRRAFWYYVFTGRLNADKFIVCLGDFLASQRGKVIVIMDGHPVYRAKKVRQWLEQRADRIEVELLPGYAPDINPDDMVWHQMRHKGTSKKPINQGESLKQRAIDDFESRRHDKPLIRSLFRAPMVRNAAA